MPKTVNSFVVWLTGLSGSGKSTLAHQSRSRFSASGIPVVVLDGDEIRSGLSRDLGFGAQDRSENIRRVAEVAKLMCGEGVATIVALISPLQTDRQRAKDIIGATHFVEVHCDCPLAVCEARDVKGLYRRARSGDLAQFTGVSAPYETPSSPDVILRTGSSGVSECVEALFVHLDARYGDVLR